MGAKFPFGWQDPDGVGQSEHRAIWECIQGALEDVPEEKHAAHALAMLEQFEEWADEMKGDLE